MGPELSVSSEDEAGGSTVRIVFGSGGTGGLVLAGGCLCQVGRCEF